MHDRCARFSKLPAIFALAVGVSACTHLHDPFASIEEQQQLVSGGKTSSTLIAKAALARIGSIDRAGPTLNSVLALNPAALSDAQRLDRERSEGRVRSALHGITIVLKDNIEMAGELPTTAGSLALQANVTDRDAPLVKRLRDAGVVLLAKTNLSEWANYRSTRSISGWSAAGGLTRNAYALDRSACGSSSGTAVAVAAGLASAGIGTETDGSIICPASMNGVVGLKPTLGLVSRRFIVPLSPQQDTAGPIARSVRDAASVLSIIAGTDPEDAVTLEADARKVDYVAALDANALAGARIGVLRGVTVAQPAADAVFEQALATLRAAGAQLIDIEALPDAHMAALSTAKGEATRTEFRAAIDDYLASTPASVTTRTLQSLIEFNRATPRETVLFGQELFELAARTKGLEDAAYIEQRSTAMRLAGPEGLDRMLLDANVEAIIAQTSGPATLVDPVNRVPFLGSPSTLPAVAGYPHLTVPMGHASGLPLGLSFIGAKWSDARILSLGFAFEQRAHGWREPTYPSTIAQRPEISAAYAHP